MSANNPFAIHHIPTHHGRHHDDFIRACAPGQVLLVSDNNAPDVQMMAQMYEDAPEAEHGYRNHPLSEEHDALWRDPVTTAVHHVSVWQADLTNRYDEAKRRGLKLPPREQIRTQGICEPIIELFARKEDMSNYDEWLAMMKARTPLLDSYMSTYIWESKKYSLPCAVGVFSRGQPANLKPGEYATYDWFPKTRQAIEANPGFAVLSVHEYNSLAGPESGRDWYTYRFMHCDWDCRIDVDEYGVWDNGYGYLNRISNVDYATQTVEYILNCQKDPRFRYAKNFTLDGNSDWETWYIDLAMPEFIAASAQIQAAQAASQPHTTYIPVITKPSPTPPTAEPVEPQPEPPVETHLPGGIIDPRVAEAVMQVESGNSGFNADGSLKIRVEAHLLLNPAYGNPAAMAQRFRFEPGDYYRGWLLVGDQWVEYHALGQAGEWQAFTEATALDRAAALCCTSFGSSQILGANFSKIGYATVEQMYQAFKRSANVHALAFDNYCRATPGLVAAINAHNFDEIARLYNGSGNVPTYSKLIRDAYVKLWGTD